MILNFALRARVPIFALALVAVFFAAVGARAQEDGASAVAARQVCSQPEQDAATALYRRTTTSCVGTPAPNTACCGDLQSLSAAIAALPSSCATFSQSATFVAALASYYASCTYVTCTSSAVAARAENCSTSNPRGGRQMGTCMLFTAQLNGKSQDISLCSPTASISACLASIEQYGVQNSIVPTGQYCCNTVLCNANRNPVTPPRSSSAMRISGASLAAAVAIGAAAAIAAAM